MMAMINNKIYCEMMIYNIIVIAVLVIVIIKNI